MDLHELARDIEPLLREYGYAAVFLSLFLESFGFPAPGESLLVGALVLYARDHLPLWPVALIAWCAAVAGDNVGYAIGRFGGRQLVVRYGRWAGVTEARLAGVETFFDRYGGWVVVIARFVVPARQLNGIVAGTAKMAWLRFLAFNVVGAALWVGAWSIAGTVLGTRTADVLVWMRDHAAIAAGIALLAAVLLVLFLWLRARRHERHQQTRRS